MRSSGKEIAQGLLKGANDHISKPFNFEEFQARVAVAERVIDLQNTLCERVRELEKAANHIKTLQGLLPICMPLSQDKK